MLVAVVASGDLAADDVRWLDRAELVIAADGGAATLDRLGRRPGPAGRRPRLGRAVRSSRSWTRPTCRSSGIRRTRTPPTPSWRCAPRWTLGATEIVLLGALGGDRLDHELANLLLLADPETARLPVRIVRGPTTARVLRSGRLPLEGRVGSLVSLLPIGADAVGVTTEGLRWALEGATLRIGRSRGISNEVVATPASVAVHDGTLLVVETASQGAPSP